MESKAGSILLLIGGILSFVGVVVLLILGAFISAFGIKSGEEVFFFWMILTFLFVMFLVFGILKIYASNMVKNPKRAMGGGILGLVVGVLSGDVLAIVGGVLAIVAAEK